MIALSSKFGATYWNLDCVGIEDAPPRSGGLANQPTLELLMEEMPRPESEAPLAPAAATASLKPASAPEAPWWKNVAVLIAVLAFALSLTTSIIAAYAAYRRDIHDQQAELSADVEKLLQIPVTEAALAYSAGGPDMTTLEPVFTEQRRMLTLEAYNLARRLGRDAGAPELMTVAELLTGFENYRAAKQMSRQATSVADNFSDEVSALRNFGLTIIRFASNDSERADGEHAFEEAMDIGSKYPDVARNPEEIAYAHALTQVAWTDAESGFDCTKAEFHIQQADKFTQAASNGPFGHDIQAMTKSWHEALTHCDKSRRLPFQFRPVIGMAASSTAQSPPPQPLPAQPEPQMPGQQPSPAPQRPKPVSR